MLIYSLIKYYLKLIKKHIRHDFYLHFTINIFQFFFISVNEVCFTMIYKTFIKHTLDIHIYFMCTFFCVPYWFLKCTVGAPKTSIFEALASFIVFILHMRFSPYWKTKQFLQGIQQQNQSFMECQHFKKH